MKGKIIILAIFSLGTLHPSNAQILWPESFSVILDSTRTIKGSVVPDLKFQTQRENLLEFENLANISVRIGKNAFTFANKIELSKFGDETLLSGGYVYVEFRRILRSKLALEPHLQVQFADARGIELRFAGGVNVRWRLVEKNRIGLFAGTGPFYEYERWNYEGVADLSLVPPSPVPVEVENIKLGSYVSFKFQASSFIFLDFSVYHQSRFDDIFRTPRLASSSSVVFNFTENLGLTMMYQNIYDFQPVVPIEKLFNKVLVTINVSF